MVNLTIVDYSLQAIFLYGYIGAAAHLPVKLFIRNGLLPEEDCLLQLDERNEKTETKYFLGNYLNTELAMGGVTRGNFDVKYFDSANNDLIQLADVFSNLYYSHLQTDAYKAEFNKLEKA